LIPTPEQRRPLSKQLSDIYVREYCWNRSGAGGLSAVVAGLESWMHKSISERRPGERIMELGAGTLNHVPYEQGASVYDVVEPFQELLTSSPHRDQVSTIYDDISAISRDNRYDRIISVAVLEHLTDLPRTLARCALLLDQRGVFRAGIPTEGAFLWGLAWRATTGVSFWLRTGLPYGAIMRHEHVNTADEILAVVNYFFRHVELRRFPLPPKHLSFYTVLSATCPDTGHCVEYL
jgi:hypothetical protein